MSGGSAKGKVILVEDDTALREATVQALELAAFDVESFDNATRAQRYLSPDFDGCLVTDIRMDGMDGLQLFGRVKQLDPDIPVILVTGHGDVGMAVRAMHEGAFDFLAKPFATDHLTAVISKAIQSRRLVLDNRALRKAVADPEGKTIARSRIMEQFRSILSQLARTETDILIHGEAGTGKEVWARELHRQSARYARPFLVISGNSIIGDPDFASAALQAEGGVLFVDGYDAMSEASQAQLVVLLDERDRQTSPNVSQADFRLIMSASSSDSATKLTTNLGNRIGSVQLHLPTLRERREDIPPLFARFVAEALSQTSKKRFEMSLADRKCLLEYDWPGNVRELRNFAFAAVLNLPRQSNRSNGQTAFRDLASRVAEFEKIVIIEALEATQGNVSRACERLKTPRKTLYEKLAKLNVDPARFRKRG